MQISKVKKLENLEQFKSWCKENSFVYPSSEIYGGFAAVYDYGHYGTLLKNNIQNEWVKSMTQERSDVVLLDSGIFMHPKTWVASGHVGGFDDVLVEDKKTHKRYRADHLIEEWFEQKGTPQSMDKKTAEELSEVIKLNNIKSPDGNELTEPRSFNLLVKSNLGTTDASFTEDNITYLRGETCQGIYLEYKNFRDTMRLKLPFGIAQVGKAFRNELVARQFVFRTREFEQMEMQYFHKPEDKKNLFEMWKNERMKWHTQNLGISPDNLRFKEHEKLIFYATAAFDIEYNFKTLGGFKELEGIHDRGDYDLTQHSKFSGEKLDYFDQESNQRFTPHIMETSVGLNRTLMMVLEEAWTEEELTNSKGETDSRIVLKLKKSLAPIKVAILPLSKKPELQLKSKEIQSSIAPTFMTQYDDTASIGKRYRRQDEIGTPYCVTIDFETLNDDAVTVRDRDSMNQERIKISELNQFLIEKF
jgi:glycyl-tRNA synthetase